ncbi:S41 family peptidase [Paludisphaera mucosa]|uniref:S41 family peptidase n=1 Tax=Paludisphaera mucosa TaxID=3030827 RepID=A0ABT6F522_9BACT|nr:S41 family peptidase [Paludisphaera mucosa]MDG3002671.1 S41 family peptidase [Paludisphaera mucosa]
MAWLLAVLLTWTTATTSPAAAREEPAAPTAAVDASKPSTPEALLERGLDLERRRNWSGAMEAYRGGMEQWPSRTDFRRRLRLCELHFKLGKRYHDASFRTVLLKLPRQQASELYAEVLERIQSFYVDAVPLEPLLRHGLDNLEVALRDPTFLKLNATTTDPGRIAWVREQLKAMRGQLAVADRNAALALATRASETARHGLGIETTPVLLEFTYGACDALDDFTSYLTPDKLEDLYAMIDGNFVGLGVELKGATEGLKLVGVIRGGPAWDAGLVAGDQIVKIAGQAVKGLALDDAANRLQGTEGTSVDLEVLKRDATLHTVRLVRRHVDVESVTRAKMVDEARGIGYVQLAGFQKSSTDEMDQAVSGLVDLGMRTLVLDLRGNPGGLLNVAVDIADRFIDSGVIVSTRGRAAGQSQVFQAGGRARWKMPMYVLVDRDSASASEILAGALQDHKRAVIVGDRTYGKGSVQSIFSLHSAPAGLKLTTAKFYSPLDRAYSERGVSPDMPVQTRVAAKPAADADPDKDSVDESTLGDPRFDLVLAAAIRASQAESQAQAVAR